MTHHMPQEIEVWYLLPALRRELANIFIKSHNLSQKEASKLLGLTESAVSQYVKLKRANELRFTGEEMKLIKECADLILKDKHNASRHIYALTIALRGTKSMCDLHKKMDIALPKDCKICQENEKLYPLGR